jgi:glucose uptake protein GlcU
MLNLLFPLASILAELSGKTVDKLNLARTRIAPLQLMLLTFAGMSLSLTLFIVLTRQPFPTVSLVSLGLVALIAVVSFGSNVFDEFSLKVDDLSLREPLSDFQTILAGLVGFVLFPAERKPEFLAVFILGTLIMYWGTHRRKLRKFQQQGMSFFLIAMLLESLLPSIYKLTLTYISPAYIGFFRVIAILMLSLLFFPLKKTMKAVTPKKVWYCLVAGVVYAAGTVASLYAIHTLGVVETMLIFMLGPALRYLVCYFILKEKVRRGEVISSMLLAIIALVAVFA